MKIDSIETQVYRIPFPVTLSDSTHGLIHASEILVLRLSCDSGVEGFGYSRTIRGMRAAKVVIDELLTDVLVGQDPFATDELWDKMWWATHWLGRGGVAALAMAACDIALWDAKGKATGHSLAELLGGSRKSVEAYVGGVNLQFPLEQLVGEAVQTVEEGFRAVKIKVGRSDPREDIERVEAVREAIGNEITLMVDANMIWSVNQAIRMARSLERYDIFWLEEPTIPDDVSGHVRIAESSAIPIAAGENLYSKYEFREYLERGAVAFPEPDVIKVGGITEWMKIAVLAAAYNLPVTSHGADQIHVHMLAAVPNASYLERHAFRIDDYLNEPFILREGHMEVPDRPGHGMVFDLEKLAPLRIA